MDSTKRNEMNIKLERAKRYIKKDIIAKQRNGKYCKFSVAANTVSVTGITLDTYIDYWVGMVRPIRATDEDLIEVREIITEIAVDKLVNGLTDLDKVLMLEKISDDSDKEKERLYKVLTNIR